MRSMMPMDRLLERIRVRRAISWIPDGSRVLDIGCGYRSSLLRALDGRIGDSIGIDPLADPSCRGRNYRLLAGRFPVDTPAAEPFDVAVMLAVLEHFPPSEAASLPEALAPVLRPGGRVVITVPAPVVDKILAGLRLLRLVAAETLEQHHGFDVFSVPALMTRGPFRLHAHDTFELGVNHLYVFERV